LKPLNHYERLKVTPDAPPEVIRAAYRALAAKLHPDRKNADVGPGDRDHDDMAALNASYLVLMDAKSRADYDLELKGGHTDQAQSDGVTASRFKSKHRAQQAGRAAAAGAAGAQPHLEPMPTQFGEDGEPRIDIDWLVSAPVVKQPWHQNPRLMMLAVAMGSMLVSCLVWWGMQDSEQAGVDRALAQQGVPQTLQTGQPQSTDALAAARVAQALMAGNSAASGAQGALMPEIAPEKLAHMSDAELLALMPQLVQDPDAAKLLRPSAHEDNKGPHMLDGSTLPGLKLAMDLPGAPLPKPTAPATP
jgi:DnaJ domain